MTVGMDMGVQMHQQAVDLNNQQIMQQQIVQQQALMSQQPKDCFVKTSGIVAPKDWKPDKYAGLGPELTPQEKLKKKYEDLRKPMYAVQTQPQAQPQQAEAAPKTFKEKVKDFGVKVKTFFQNIAQKITCAFKKDCKVQQ